MDEHVVTDQDCYYQQMKPVVGPGQLAGLRTRYGLSERCIVQVSRYAPRELQEAAFAKGLMPYIPADRAEVDEAPS